MQSLSSEDRSEIIRKYAGFLVDRSHLILDANKADLEAAKHNSESHGGLFNIKSHFLTFCFSNRKEIGSALMGRLALNKSKLKTLADGLHQIANNSNILGKVLKYTKLADGLLLKQVTVPIGVLMVIFESRPDSLPQVLRTYKLRNFETFVISIFL